MAEMFKREEWKFLRWRLDLLISDLHLQCETADPASVPRLQGEIKAIRKILGERFAQDAVDAAKEFETL